MSTSRAPAAAWKGHCLPGNLPLSSLSILSSGDTHIPMGPLISRPCDQQQLPQLWRGEMIDPITWLRGHFLPHALPTFFFAQFNLVSLSYTPLDNSKKFLSPSCSIFPSNICRWLLFLLSHYLAQPLEVGLSSFPVIQCL